MAGGSLCGRTTCDSTAPRQGTAASGVAGLLGSGAETIAIEAWRLVMPLRFTAEAVQDWDEAMAWYEAAVRAWERSSAPNWKLRLRESAAIRCAALLS